MVDFIYDNYTDNYEINMYFILCMYIRDCINIRIRNDDDPRYMDRRLCIRLKIYSFLKIYPYTSILKDYLIYMDILGVYKRMFDDENIDIKVIKRLYKQYESYVNDTSENKCFQQLNITIKGLLKKRKYLI